MQRDVAEGVVGYARHRGATGGVQHLSVSAVFGQLRCGSLFVHNRRFKSDERGPRFLLAGGLHQQ